MNDPTKNDKRSRAGSAIEYSVFGTESFFKYFPIDFMSPIDFSQLHMIRPLVSFYEPILNMYFGKIQF